MKSLEIKFPKNLDILEMIKDEGSLIITLGMKRKIKGEYYPFRSKKAWESFKKKNNERVYKNLTSKI